MYIIKNAFTSVKRAKGRSILIFILVLIVAVSTCIALSIRNSAETVKTNTYASMSVTAQIGVDREKMMQSMDGGKPDKDSMKSMMSDSLSLKELKKYAKSEYVENFYYTESLGMSAPDGFEIYETTNGAPSSESSDSTDSSDSSTSTDSGQSAQANPGGDMRGGMMQQDDLTVVGVSSHDAMTSFVSGENTISDGAVFDEDSTDGTCVISAELAALNDLSVGDVFTLTGADDEKSYTFTICGLFTNSTSDVYANQVFVSVGSLEKMVEDNESDASLRLSGTYECKNVNNYEKFAEDCETMGLDTTKYAVSSNDLEQFEQSMVPLESLSKFAGIFFYVILIVGGGILLIFNIFSIRERKYEIGVLAAIGMKKGKVACQFLAETFIITFVAIIIGSGVGIVAAQPIGNYLLQSQITSTQESSQKVNNHFGGNFQGGQGGPGGQGEFSGQGSGSASSAPSGGGEKGGMRGQVASYVESINTSVNLQLLLSLMGVTLLLTLAAGGAGIVSVLRYDPLKILSERS